MSKKTVILLVSLALLILALPLTISLVKQRQEVRKKAAVPAPEGIVEIVLQPISGSIAVGGTLPVNMVLDLKGLNVNTLQVYLDCSYSSAEVPIEVVDQDSETAGVQISALRSDLTYLTNEARLNETTRTIRIGLNSFKLGGFSETTPFTYGTITFRGVIPGPITCSYDSQLSKVITQEDPRDVLLPSTSVGSYTITSEATVTPTPTETPTGYPTSTPTSLPTSTPTAIATSTPTLTPTPTSPGVGGSEPTATPTPTPKPACSDTPPGTPINLQATSGPGVGEITLTWTRVSGADYYSLVFGNGPLSYQWGAANIGNVGRYVVRELTPGKPYYLAVAAVRGCASSGFSQEASARAKGIERTTTSALGTPTPTSLIPTPTLPYRPIEEVFPDVEFPTSQERRPSPSLTPTPTIGPEEKGLSKDKLLALAIALVVLAVIVWRLIRRKLPPPPPTIAIS